MYKSRRNNSRSPDRNKKINYDVPDTSKGDYYCVLCDARMNCVGMWEAHKIGKRHITNMKKPPGEAPSKVKAVRVDDEPLIADLLDETTEPIVGLDYICETRRSDTTIDPFYNCYLCQATCPTMAIIEHICSFKHRLAYLKRVDPENTQMLEDFRLPKSQFEPMLRSHCFDKENELGRGKMEVKMEKSHGQVVQGGKLKTKIPQFSSYRAPMKPEYQDTNRWNYASTSHYDGPSYYGPPPPLPPVGPYPMGRSDLPPHLRHESHYDPYGPSTSHYNPNPYPPMGPMNAPVESSLKLEKSKMVDNTTASTVKVRKRSPKIKKRSPEPPPPPRTPTPEPPPFEFDFDAHMDFLSPYHLLNMVQGVFEDATKDNEQYTTEEEKFDLLSRAINMKYTSSVKATYEKATPDKKKAIECKLSKRGEDERNQRIKDVTRVPGVTNF